MSPQIFMCKKQHECHYCLWEFKTLFQIYKQSLYSKQELGYRPWVSASVREILIQAQWSLFMSGFSCSGLPLHHVLAKMENMSSILDPTQPLRGFFFFFNEFVILQLLTSLYLSSYTIFSHNDFWLATGT